jgi:hypothetical protein
MDYRNLEQLPERPTTPPDPPEQPERCSKCDAVMGDYDDGCDVCQQPVCADCMEYPDEEACSDDCLRRAVIAANKRRDAAIEDLRAAQVAADDGDFDAVREVLNAQRARGYGNTDKRNLAPEAARKLILAALRVAERAYAQLAWNTRYERNFRKEESRKAHHAACARVAEQVAALATRVASNQEALDIAERRENFERR